MKRKRWRAQHKWLGLILSFFLLMFCLSGPVLNHPSLFSGLNVSRTILPESYRYKNWNGGLVRGSLSWSGRVLVYGNSGIFLTDSLGSSFHDFNKGLPKGADWRIIRGLVTTKSGHLFAESQYGLFVYDANKGWKATTFTMQNEERLTDITAIGDSLIVTGRNYVYVSRPPYNNFKKITLKKASDYDGKTSLFMTVWKLHSGALFGIVGKLVVDCIAIVIIILIITGLLFWFLPKTRYRGHAIKHSSSIHNKLGKTTIVLTLFVVISGWMLRPPGLILLASGRVPSLHRYNPWYDNLRALRYDTLNHDWLLSSGNGFYSLKTLNSTPKPIKQQPDVSVMGINVLSQDKNGVWAVGSFSGLYYWDRQHNTIKDVFPKTEKQNSHIPISSHAISGLCRDFKGGDVIVDYNKGTTHFKMPSWMSTLPMSLRLFALEVHTGRIYPFGFGGMLYIFLIGIAIVWCLWSGWKITRHS